MENGQLPPTQTVQSSQGLPMVQQVQAEKPKTTKDNSGLKKTILLIIFALVAVTFIGLFVWIYMEYDTLKTNYDADVATEAAKIKDEQQAIDDAKCQKEKEYPYSVFAGPVDYGELNFEYPKTWSVYIAKDAANGGDFEAYLNPIQIEPISNTSINALRVKIVNKSFDDMTKEYQRYLESREKNLSVESVTVNGVTANLYTGTIPNTELNGYILIFKIRDKTAILQTDSVLFKESYDKLIQTIKFNS